tara:strand:+ start:1374 stop:1919 length:546 start_codon:yes stop_codon:yes gene_type:complete
MVVKKTTTQLVGELIEVEQEILLEEDIDRTEELVEIKNNLQVEVKNKIQNVDHFMLELSKKEHLIDANVEALKDEINRLKNKRKGLERTKDFFNRKLLPAVIEEIGNEGVYETDTARYKLYETFGPVQIDAHELHSDFKKVEIVEKIDKVKARKAAIDAFNSGMDMPPGVDIDKVKRVKRT